MKLEIAIRILEDQGDKGYHFPDQQRKEASKLGAEALKLIQRSRQPQAPIKLARLPGETE